MSPSQLCSEVKGKFSNHKLNITTPDKKQKKVTNSAVLYPTRYIPNPLSLELCYSNTVIHVFIITFFFFERLVKIH